VQIVVLAGGRGTRLLPLTKDTPKSLIPILGKPFIEYQLELFKSHGIDDVVLCVGYLADKIIKHLGDGERFGLTIRYSVEKEPLGTAGALKEAEELLEEQFLLTYGDSYLQVDYTDVLEYLKARDRLGVMVVYKNFDRFDRSNVVVEQGLVKTYDKNRKEPGMIYIDYGLLALRKESLSIIPRETVMDLQCFYKALINTRQLLAYEATKRFFEIGSPAGLSDFEDFASHALLEVI